MVRPLRGDGVLELVGQRAELRYVLQHPVPPFELLVEFEQVSDGVVLEGRLVAVLDVLVEEVAELRPPVPEVVVAGHVVTALLQDVHQRVAEDGVPEVADVEGLGDVGRGDVRDDPVGIGPVTGAVRRPVGVDFAERQPGHRRRVEMVVDVAALDGDTRDAFGEAVVAVGVGDRVGDVHRVLAGSSADREGDGGRELPFLLVVEGLQFDVRRRHVVVVARVADGDAEAIDEPASRS